MRFARGRIGLVVQHRGEAPAHVPLQIIGQHAEQHVGAHARRGPVEYGTQFEIDGLQRAEGVLDEAMTAIGMAFSGNPFANDGAGVSYANPLPKVIAGLDIDKSP